jgi:serine/threonine protein kinase/tetratricopeptide (TPR) repeat protein
MSMTDRLLKALRERLLGGASEEPPTRAFSRSKIASAAPERLGRYRIVRKIGQGGMGVVYAAHDDGLDRTVAVKVIAAEAADETAVRRFQREARAAAAVNHPNICQLYEIGEHEGSLFIAMEMLQGEALSERLPRGALPVAEAVPVALGVLAALSALHARDLVHRDLKPSNVFLTPHGVKLLDFGLARKGAPSESLSRSMNDTSILTTPGMIVGTPGYMAPEQVRGEEVDARADLFALGAILFEMLAGRPPFSGSTMVEVLYATLHEQPPALSGSAAVVAIDRVIRKALSKRAADRPESAEAMASSLGAIGVDAREGETRARALTRLVVLPFRMLRPDPDTDFLALGLADAVSTSLSSLGSMVVRSSASAARFAVETPDLKRIAAEADVDLVVMGTLLRSGDRLRATAQLVEAPAGTLTLSHTVEAPVGDVFRLQDELSGRIVESLALPLRGRSEDTGLRRRAPSSPLAYELYLRANHVSREYEQMPVARDLYLRAVEEDPGYAPAWARLGRAHRLIGKFFEDPIGNRDRAEYAFRRALELDPDLAIAHKLYAHFEAEWGGAPSAMVRLIERAKLHREDAELFAGLVHACRYSGLFEASVAAHEEARRLDPHVPTSLAYTLYLSGDYDRLTRETESVLDLTPKALGLAALGRRDEALAVLDELDRTNVPRTFGLVVRSIRVLLSEGERDPAIVEETTRVHSDPEALFMFATLFAALGRKDRALDVLRGVVEKGFYVTPAFQRDPLLASVREEPEFAAIVEAAEAGRRRALRIFEEAGGPRLLGLG